MTSLSLASQRIVFRRRALLGVENDQVGIGLRRHPLVVAVEMVGRVQRGDNLEARLAEGIHVQLGQVELRSVVEGVPRVGLAIPHGEPIVVLHAGAHVARTGIEEELGPGIGIPVAARRGQRGGELHEAAALVLGAVDEVVVRPVGVGIAVGCHVMGVHAVGVTRLVVHVARVPLAIEGGDAVHPPVKVDAELGVLEPLRSRCVGVDRGPGCRVRRLPGRGDRPHGGRREASERGRECEMGLAGNGHGWAPRQPSVQPDT